MILSIKQIIKVLIRLRGCTGWTAPLLFENLRRQVFSCRGPIVAVEFHLPISLQIVFELFMTDNVLNI